MRALLPLLLVGLVGCPAEEPADDTSNVDDTSGDDPVVIDYTINGNAVFADAPTTPVPEGTCIALLDPTNVPLTGEFEEVQTGTIGAAGAFTFENVDRKPPIGWLINVTDCDDVAEADQIVGISSNTGLLPSSFLDVEEGGSVDDVRALVIGVEYLAALQGSLSVVAPDDPKTKDVNETPDLATVGMLYGVVFDGATPAGGATVTCKGCADFPTYYIDAEPETTAPVPENGFAFANAAFEPNTATVDGVGSFVIPAAPLSQYTASSDTLNLGDEPLTIGSAPGAAVIVAFFAQ